MDDVFADLRTKPTFTVEDIEDFSVVSKDNHTLLQEAIVRRTELAVALVQRGVPLDHQDENGQTALQYALARSENTIAEAILSGGANPNLVDKYGNNAVWTAVMNPRSDYKIIEALYLAEADVHHKNHAGRSPTDMARTKNNERLKKLFQVHER